MNTIATTASSFRFLPARLLHVRKTHKETDAGTHYHIIVVSVAHDVTQTAIIMSLIYAQLMIHFLVWLLIQVIINKLFQVINHLLLRQLVGLETIFRQYVVFHILRTARSLIQIIVVVGNLLQNSQKVITLRIVVLLSVGSITLYHQKRIIILMG